MSIHPDYYTRLDPEPWDVMLELNLNPIEGFALKYLARAGRKPEVSFQEDVLKAITCFERLMDDSKTQGWTLGKMRIPEEERIATILTRWQLGAGLDTAIYHLLLREYENAKDCALAALREDE